MFIASLHCYNTRTKLSRRNIEDFNCRYNIHAAPFINNIIIIVFLGQIQITNEYVTVGQSVIITCSTKCAWNWHTVIIDGDVIDAASFTGNNDYEINRTNEILNCQDCNEPDDVDCSNDSQGPVQSVLNITLLAVGDHYIQCIAHLFDPNSDLWPSNRILSVPSRMLKITGTEVDTQDETLSCE